MLAIALVPPVLGPACTSLPLPPGAQPSAAPTFSPQRFFEGDTEGTGVLRIVGHRRRPVHVRGSGRVKPDGLLVLSQSVEEGGKPPRQRRWTIRQVSPGKYAGTLSDAAGPVTGEVVGNLLHLRFRMAGGLAAEQRLYLQADGRSAENRLVVRKLGITVAVLDETIRKVDGADRPPTT